jgi:DNA helicase-2/ATP-dependent DNA helicase PcrA
MSTASHLEHLNEKQRKAVLTTEGPLLIIAGAGAGKTRTITHRIVHLIKNGIDPQNILAVTFTNKAAKEMQERMRTLLNTDKEINHPVNALSSGMAMPFMATFHSLGVHILRENAKELNIPRNFTIFDRSDSLRAIKNALKKHDYDPKQYEPKTILSIISKSKGNNVGREEFTGSAGGQNYYGEIAAKCWQEYEKALKKEGALDFDDLLITTHDLLATHPEIREKYQKRWQYIHIDEYQDTNAVQYDLVRLLVGDAQNICVVGDGDQCVYTWRQAKPENINHFENEFYNVKTVLLEQNYRSTSNILAAANDIITKNINRKDKNLFTENPEGESLSIYGAFSAND